MRPNAVCLVVLFACLSAPSVSRAAEASSSTEKPQFTLDDIKGGKLFRHGFSFGAAFQVHVPRSGGRQQGFGFGLTPFLALHPRAWWIGDETSAYCAARWDGFDEDRAKNIANEVARARTIEFLEKERKQAEKEGKPVGPAVSKAEPDQIAERTGWDEKLPGAGCWKQWLGLYVGIPSKFKVDAVLAGDAPVYSEFNPLFSAGLVVSPKSYISGTFGFTRSRVALSGGPSHLVTSVSVGVGGSLEIFGLIIGK